MTRIGTSASRHDRELAIAPTHASPGAMLPLVGLRPAALLEMGVPSRWMSRRLEVDPKQVEFAHDPAVWSQ
jgi:hypothetical protein